MEDHLRNLIEKYQQFLFDLAADEDATKQAFVYQFLEQVERCNSEEIHTGEAKAKTFYKLAAIDVDCRDVHNILIDLKGSAGEALKPFFDLILGDRALEDVFGVDDMDSRIVTATHVTLGHFKTVSQSEFRDIYDPLSGLVTNIKVTSLLWGKEAAALQVTCDNKTECGKEIPAPKNDFAHITVWFQKGASAVKSNLLPKLVETGEAQKLDFETPVSLRGTISLWES